MKTIICRGKHSRCFIRRKAGQVRKLPASRLTDRPLRPAAAQNLRREIQIINTVLSADQENDPTCWRYRQFTVLAMSEIPFDGRSALSASAYINDEMVLNPTLGTGRQ